MQAGSSNKTVGQKTALKRTHSQTFDQKWHTKDTEVTIADVMAAVKDLSNALEEVLGYLIECEDDSEELDGGEDLIEE